MFCCCAAPILLLGGCTTYFEDQRNEDARMSTEIENHRTDIDQLKARMDALEKLQQDFDSRMATVRGENDKKMQDIREQLAAMDVMVKACNAARETDRQAIINDLTAKIAKIAEMMKPHSTAASSSAAERPVPPRPPEPSAHGKEHVVKPGETLSSIATACKVKVSAIVQANNLKNADSLKAGQRLVIPEQE